MSMSHAISTTYPGAGAPTHILATMSIHDIRTNYQIIRRMNAQDSLYEVNRYDNKCPEHIGMEGKKVETACIYGFDVPYCPIEERGGDKYTCKHNVSTMPLEDITNLLNKYRYTKQEKDRKKDNTSASDMVAWEVTNIPVKDIKNNG